MPQHVTKQPNGKYAIFSSTVDHFIGYDATPEEVYEHFRQKAIEESDRHTKRSLEHADHFGESRLVEDLETVALIHGQPEADKYREMLSQGSPDGEAPQGPPVESLPIHGGHTIGVSVICPKCGMNHGPAMRGDWQFASTDKPE